MNRNQTIQSLLDHLVARPLHAGVALSVYDVNLGSEAHFSAGEFDHRKPFFATGLTKLYATAIILQLLQEKKLDLSAPFMTYMQGDRTCAELHVMDGVDYTHWITIEHLLGHTSGLSDHFIFAPSRLTSLSFRPMMVQKGDQSWSFEEAMTRARSHGGLFRPGDAPKASYADTNFHLLGRVIEQIEQKDFADVVKDRITRPLGLGSSYIYFDPADRRPAPLLLSETQMRIPRIMSSLGAEGGLVTSTREALLFLRAFFEGYLFDKSYLDVLQDWRTYSRSIDTGLGLHRLKLPWWQITRLRLKSPVSTYLAPSPSIVGHLGWTGCFALFEPELGYYITGATNQMCDVKIAAKLGFKTVDILRASSRRAGARVSAPAA